MSYAYLTKTSANIAEIFNDPDVVDVVVEFLTESKIKFADIDRFYPDLHAGNYWIFVTKDSKQYGMARAHTVWNPDVVTTEIELLA